MGMKGFGRDSLCCTNILLLWKFCWSEWTEQILRGCIFFNQRLGHTQNKERENKDKKVKGLKNTYISG